MTGVLRLGVLGTSEFARRRVLPAVEASPRLELAAVASRRGERVAEVVARFGGRPATGYDDVLADPEVDAVYVPLPCELHDVWARAALRAGKHVLVEKPLAATGPRADELLAEAARAGRVLRENTIFLHHPAHAAVRAMVDAGRLGPLRAFSAAFAVPPLPADDIRYDAALAGGALRDVGMYPLRGARLFLGAGLEVTGATLRHDPVRAVDVAGQVLLASPAGVLADLTFGFEHTYGARYTLWGETARLTLDRAWTPPATHRPVVRVEEQDRVEEITLPAADQVARCLEEFAAAATTGDPAAAPDVDPAVGAEVAHLIDTVERRAVRVPVGDPVPDHPRS